jgi:hypothetical protein
VGLLMTTSGTYAFDSIEQVDVITEAFERIGRIPSTLTSNDIDSARRSLNFMFSEWANNGPNLWAVELVTLPLVAGQQSYALDPSTIYITQAAVRTTQNGVNTDLVISPISRAEYLALPNKAQQAQKPTQFYLERTNPPSLKVWPVPQDNSVTMLYYRMRTQQDAGDFTNNLDAPGRLLEAIAAGLAAKLAMKFSPDRAGMLTEMALAAYQAAIREDRERVPMRFLPTLRLR